MKNIEITRDGSERSKNRERDAFTETDGQNDIPDRLFSHVSTVIEISYDLYHCKYVTDRKTIVLEPNITRHVKHLLTAR